MYRLKCDVKWVQPAALATLPKRKALQHPESAIVRLLSGMLQLPNHCLFEWLVRVGFSPSASSRDEMGIIVASTFAIFAPRCTQGSPNENLLGGGSSVQRKLCLIVDRFSTNHMFVVLVRPISSVTGL